MARRNLRALLRLIDEHPRVIRVIEAPDGHIDIQLSPAAPVLRPAEKVEDTPPEPTPDEWLRAQYKQPDGT